jgi:hypothetical protein
MSTHVCFVGRQHVPNLLGVLAHKPARMVPLSTEDERLLNTGDPA